MARGAPGISVVRTGAGPRRSRIAAASLPGSLRPRSLAVAGVAGALNAGLDPGTLVVADRVLDDRGREVAVLGSARILAGELQRRGARVAVGPVISTPRVAEREERSSLAATGAVAVDCETAYLLSTDWGLPTAVVRAVVDTPERELRSPATVTGGLAALRALRSAAPALEAWAGCIAPRRVLLAGPRSFCAGVERAIATVEQALDRFGPPVYVRRQIVHNRHVVGDLQSRGAVFVQELDDVPAAATVVLSAHGVSPAVRAQAESRRLRVVDATCPLVAKVHREVRRFADQGYELVLIGHPGHDETDGTLGEAERIRLVTSVEDVDRLEVGDTDRIAYTTQTTLSPADVAEIVGRLSERFPAIVGPHSTDICYATQNRQDAVTAIAAECDLMIVVGSSNSSNAARLVEVAERSGCRAVLVEDDGELAVETLRPAATVGVTAAASTPPHLVEQVVAAIAAMGGAAAEERSTKSENVNFPLPLEVR